MTENEASKDDPHNLADRYLRKYKTEADLYMTRQTRATIAIIVLSAFNTGLIALTELIGTIGVILATIISASIAIATSLQSSFKYKDLWVRYREAQWKVTVEKMRFNASVGDYSNLDQKEKKTKYDERIIDIIDWERKGWREAFEDDAETDQRV